MEQNDTKTLMKAFDNAVTKFWVAATGFKGEELSLTDAANDVLLAYEDISGHALDEKSEKIVQTEMQDVKETIADKDLPLTGRAQTTATGARTFKILNNPSRFDA